MQLTLQPGQVIFSKGDASDAAYIVEEGEVDIFAPTPQGKVLLASLGKGQIFGEMGLIDGQPRSASAVAKTLGRIRVIDRAAVGTVLAQLPEEYRLLLMALSERLRETNQKLAHAVVQKAELTLLTPGQRSVPPVNQLTIRPAHPDMEKSLPKQGVVIQSLPFRVGSLPEGEAPNPLDWNNLAISGANMALFGRNHFAIQKTAEGLLVADRGSPSGTVVNGTAIGQGCADYKAVLQPGINRVVAGGELSPYRFDLIWE